MGVDVIKPVFNLDPKYRVSMLTREEQTRGPGMLWLKGSSVLWMGQGLWCGLGLGSVGNL
jgi:hypothetical protein